MRRAFIALTAFLLALSPLAHGERVDRACSFFGPVAAAMGAVADLDLKAGSTACLYLKPGWRALPGVLDYASVRGHVVVMVGVDHLASWQQLSILAAAVAGPHPILLTRVTRAASRLLVVRGGLRTGLVMATARTLLLANTTPRR